MKRILYFFFLMLISVPAWSDNFYFRNVYPPEILNLYNLKGENLKGNVFSVAIYDIGFSEQFGSIKETGYHKLVDSLRFDNKGDKVFSLNCDNGTRVYRYAGDSIIIDHRNYPSIQVNVKDNNDRLVESVVYDDKGNIKSKVNFNNLTQGYDGTYWPDPKTEVKFSKKGNTILGYDNIEVKQFVIDNKGQLIKESFRFNNETFNAIAATAGKLGKEKIYKYNDKGDIIENPKGEKFEYIYDEEGNWIERKTFEQNGRLRYLTKRIIEYKTPEEYTKYEEEERLKQEESNRKIKEEAFEYFKNFADTRYDINMLTLRRGVRRDNLNMIKPIKNFKVDNDIYSFVFDNGKEYKDIKFNNKNNIFFDGYISQGNEFVLIPIETYSGLEWVIVHFDEIFRPGDDIDIISFYNQEFANKEKLPTIEEKNSLWNSIIWDEWKKFSGNEWDRDYEYPNTKNIIANAYELGFVSPSIADKQKEEEINRKAQKQMEFDQNYEIIMDLISDRADLKKIKKISNEDKTNYQTYILSFILDDGSKFDNIEFESMGEMKECGSSKYSNNLRSFLDRNSIRYSKDGKLALIQLDHNPVGPETKSILIVNLQERYGNYIPDKQWNKANQLSKFDYKNLYNAAKGLRK